MNDASQMSIRSIFRKDNESMINRREPSGSSQLREQDQEQFPPSPEMTRRAAPMRSAPFNPENLGGPTSAPDVYSSEEGVYRVNIAMFDPPKPTGRKETGETIHVTSKAEPAYVIPRPVVDAEPAVIHGRGSPVPDYASEDSSSTITHL